MTIPQHVVQSGLICYLFPQLRRWYIIGAAIVLAILPDVGRLFQRDPDDWAKFYQWAHSTWYCYLIPFWNLHIAEDYFIHQPHGGWYWWAYYVEVLLWVMECIIIGFIIKRSHQKKQKYFRFFGF